jgi:hypothetical protein
MMALCHLSLLQSLAHLLVAVSHHGPCLNDVTRDGVVLNALEASLMDLLRKGTSTIALDWVNPAAVLNHRQMCLLI